MSLCNHDLSVMLLRSSSLSVGCSPDHCFEVRDFRILWKGQLHCSTEARTTRGASHPPEAFLLQIVHLIFIVACNLPLLSTTERLQHCLAGRTSFHFLIIIQIRNTLLSFLFFKSGQSYPYDVKAFSSSSQAPSFFFQTAH